MNETILDNKFIYRNKEWLDHQINVLGKSQTQLAKEINVSRSTIGYWIGNEIENKREYYKKNEDSIKVYQKGYYARNKDIISEGKHKYYEEHKTENQERNKLTGKRNYIAIKTKALNIVGKQECRCEICGDADISHLTIDHINKDGSLDRAKGLRGKALYYAIVNNKYENINNLRVLCWNHNCSRIRSYLDIPYENQTVRQKYVTKLWKDAFEFFGPCHCGETELKFLTISHIHNDGAERRRKGEGVGRGLIGNFRKQGWPQSLKEDFCLECWSCNCSHGTNNFI